MNTFESARSFVYRNARPLDLALWQYHFENHDKENVLKVLSFYQKDDGSVNATWQWRNEFIKEFAVSENYWKSNLTLNNMRYLKAFDQI